MYTTYSEQEVQQRVTAALNESVDTPVSQMSQQLGLSEGAITLALPSDMVGIASGEHVQFILQQLAQWGKVTTIVHSCGSIFEVKASFPQGKVAYGYYNLLGENGQMHGHLKIDRIAHIAFVSKPLRGKESHYIAFFTAEGECVFKVYLGRDEERRLFPQQMEAFEQMKKELVQ